MMIKERSISLNRGNKMSVLDRAVLLLYSLYFILNPFYLWSSGLPQIADFFLVTGIVVYFVSFKFSIRFNKVSKPILLIGLLFISWITIVNLWSLSFTDDYDFLRSTAFYIYNFIIFIFIIALVNKYENQVYGITYKAILFSLTVELLVYLFVDQSSVRAIGSFNNPNQLGYYALLMLSYIIFLSKKIKVHAKWLIVGVLFSTILSLASLSKAAIIAHIGLLIFYVFSKSSNKTLKRKVVIFLVFLSIGVGVIYHTTDIIQSNSLISSVERRIASIGSDSDDNFGARGYYRIFEHPEYWIFGAGEGDYSRFKHKNIEFHSTIGNIQVSYGFIGSLLFSLFIILAMKNDKFENWNIIFFLMLYGLTHNGIRNTLFWIILALMSERKIFIKGEIK
ncbi:hypothetical protein QUF55_04430 [Clostridiaceae bacterium HSG29]|nr:hypothetical protein [Clostridiaceae bacterium HSG29]